MTIQVSGVSNGARSSTINLTAPTRDAGDLLVIMAVCRGVGTGTFPDLSGWQKVPGAEHTLYGRWICAWMRRASGDASDDVAGFAAFGTSASAHVMYRLTGDIPADLADLVIAPAILQGDGLSWSLGQLTSVPAGAACLGMAYKAKTSTQDSFGVVAPANNYTMSYNGKTNGYTFFWAFFSQSDADGGTVDGGDIDFTGGDFSEAWATGAIAFTYDPPASGYTLTGGMKNVDATTGPTGNKVDLGATTDGADGALRWYVSASATPPSAADLVAGTGAVSYGSQAVSAAGAQQINNVGSLNEKTTYYGYLLHRSAGDLDSNILELGSLIIPADAPTLSSATAAASGSTGGSLSVATSRAGVGTMYVVVTTSSTKPSAAQIQAGQDHLGASASWSGSQASPTATQGFAATGLSDGQGYYAHFYHVDAGGDGSAVATSGSFTPSSGRSIQSVSPAVPKAGETVSVSLAGGWSASGKTLQINGRSVELTSQDAVSAEFTCPDLNSNPSFDDTRYGIAYTMTLSDSGADVTRQLTIDPAAGDDWVQITGIGPDGILANDVGVSVGDWILGRYTSGGGDPVSSMGVLENIQLPAVYEYQIFDASSNLWSASAVEVLNPMIVHSGVPPAVPRLYVGVAMVSFDGSSGFNKSETTVVGYAIATGTLPAGLSLNTSTGAITGTPSAGSKGDYTGLSIRAANSEGQTADTPLFTIEVHDDPVWVSVPAPVFKDGNQGAYDLKQNMALTNQAPVSFSLIAGSLPQGVSLSSLGVISGTVGVAESASSPFAGIKVRATNPAGAADSATFPVIVNPSEPIVIEPEGPPSFPQLTVGQAISPVDVSDRFVGGEVDLYQLVGSWPAGLQIDGSGVITGAPTAAGEYTGLRVRATNASGTAQTGTFGIMVVVGLTEPSFGVIGGITLAEDDSGLVKDFSLDVTAGSLPITFRVSSGALPSGVTLNAKTGRLFAAGDRGNEGIYEFEISVANPAGEDSSGVVLTITSSDPVLETPIADQSDMEDLPASVDVRSSFAGYSSLSATGLPPGIRNRDGILSGVPIAPGEYTVTVTALNLYGSVQDSFVWTVEPTPTPPVMIGSLDDMELVQGDEVSLDLEDYISGATSFSADVLPAGLSLVGSVISGTVTTIEVVLTTITASNDDGDITPTINWNVESGAPVLRVQPPTMYAVNGRLIGRDMKKFFIRAGTVTLQAGTLPTGLSVVDGVVTGTPTVNGTATGIVLRCTNAFGSVDTEAFSWTIRTAIPSKGVVLAMGLG